MKTQPTEKDERRKHVCICMEVTRQPIDFSTGQTVSEFCSLYTGNSNSPGLISAPLPRANFEKVPPEAVTFPSAARSRGLKRLARRMTCDRQNSSGNLQPWSSNRYFGKILLRRSTERERQREREKSVPFSANSFLFSLGYSRLLATTRLLSHARRFCPFVRHRTLHACSDRDEFVVLKFRTIA